MDCLSIYPRWQQLFLLGLVLIGSWQNPYTHAAAGQAASVAVSNFQFTPAIITIPTGTTVSWANAGSSHNVVADDGSFTSGAPAPQFTFEQQFNTPGIYRYYCILHGAPGGIGMSGQVVVTSVTVASSYLPLVVR